MTSAAFSSCSCALCARLAEKAALAQENARQAEAKARAQLEKTATVQAAIAREKAEEVIKKRAAEERAKAEAETRATRDAALQARRDAEARTEANAEAAAQQMLLAAPVLDLAPAGAGGFDFFVQGAPPPPQPLPDAEQEARVSPPPPEADPLSPSRRSYSSEWHRAAIRIQAFYRGKAARDELYWDLMGYA